MRHVPIEKHSGGKRSRKPYLQVIESEERPIMRDKLSILIPSRKGAKHVKPIQVNINLALTNTFNTWESVPPSESRY